MHSMSAVTIAGAALLILPADVPAQVRMPRLRDAVAKVAPVAGAQVGVVQFNENVLEITSERLGQLLDGLRAEEAMARRVDAQDTDAIERARAAIDERYRREDAAYQAALAKYDECVDKNSAETMRRLEAMQPTAEEEARIKAVQKRIEAAQAAGNTAEMMRLADSLGQVGARLGQAAMAATSELQQRVAQACGTRPVEPTRATQQGVLTYEDIVRAGETASRLNGRAYRILRERVAPLVLGQSSSGLTYQPSELSAINEAMSSLKPFAGVLQRH